MSLSRGPADIADYESPTNEGVKLEDGDDATAPVKRKVACMACRNIKVGDLCCNSAFFRTGMLTLSNSVPYQISSFVACLLLKMQLLLILAGDAPDSI
jgi:hypothetical protein